MTATVKTITHGQMLTIASPKGEKVYATAHRAGGYYREAGYSEERIAMLMARAKERGDAEFSSINPGSFITNSRAIYEQDRAERAQAIELVDGEDVMFDGTHLIVKFVRAGVQDPIHFRAFVPDTIEV